MEPEIRVVGGHGARLPRLQKRCRLLQAHAVVAEQQVCERRRCFSGVSSSYVSALLSEVHLDIVDDMVLDFLKSNEAAFAAASPLGVNSFTAIRVLERFQRGEIFVNII